LLFLISSLGPISGSHSGLKLLPLDACGFVYGSSIRVALFKFIVFNLPQKMRSNNAMSKRKQTAKKKKRNKAKLCDYSLVVEGGVSRDSRLEKNGSRVMPLMDFCMPSIPAPNLWQLRQPFCAQVIESDK